MDGGHLPALSRPAELADRLEAYLPPGQMGGSGGTMFTMGARVVAAGQIPPRSGQPSGT